MKTETMYIAYTSKSSFWGFTVPRKTREDAYYSAENQVSQQLLRELGIDNPPGDTKYGIWLRSEHPKVVLLSHDYIGEVRAVEVPESMRPNQYRKWYCEVRPLESDVHTDGLGEAFA